MSLTTGTRLGPYEILSALGAGGMGEVYRARDTKLGRDVAIKVLPEHFAADPERLARFQREAQVLASLNHPHIAAIHGVEESNGIRALVLELVEGKTLAEVIARGPIPVQEALPFATQIAEALEAAHEQGIIHRDLKPANVKVRPDGSVKVLDFGLAKALGPASGPAEGEHHERPSISNSPTMMASMPGMILGTAAYMSPEQARGKPVDKRADIWAFGCVLYEMLTGRAAFGGATLTDTLAAIVNREPDWRALPAVTPPAVHRLLQRCLEKDPKSRLRDVGDARIDITDAVAKPAGETIPPIQRPAAARVLWRRTTALIVAATVFGAVVSGVAVWNLTRRGSSSPPVVSRWLITPPAAAPLADLAEAVLAVSPDGTRIAYLAEHKPGGGWGVFIRELDGLESRMIPGSEIPREAPLTGHTPFFSPDGTWIGFRSPGQGIMRAALAGGPPVKILDDQRAWIAEWEPDDTLIFWAGGNNGLFRISASRGGSPEPLMAKPEPGVFHLYPRLLPGGGAVLFTRFENQQAYGVAVLDVETREQRIVIESGGWANYTATGHLVFFRGTTLMAAPFDLARLAVMGEPVAVLEGVRFQDFAVSQNGTLVYVPDRAPAVETAKLVWVNRNGQVVGPVVSQEIENPRDPRLSPDGRRLALITGPATASDLWVFDLGGRPPLPLFEERNNLSPVWSPDGTRVAFSSGGPGTTTIYWLPADGSARDPRAIGTSGTQAFPGAWLPSGELLFWAYVVNQFDIRAVSIDGGGKPRDLVVTNDLETAPALSPDRRWLAYASNRSGRNEIWVRPYTAGTPVRVSQNGGLEPVWSRDGRELFYLEGNSMMAVAVKTGDAEFAFDPAHELFKAGYVRPPGFGNASRSYDVATDGRFLMIQPVGSRADTLAPASIVVVENWTEELKRLVPTR